MGHGLVFQAANGEDLVILACTAFDWSTHVTDGQTDGRMDRQTDRIAMAKLLHVKMHDQI